MERPNETEETKTQNQMTMFLNRTKEQKVAIQKQKDEEAYKSASKFIGVFVRPLVVMLLWNWLMPGLFGFVTLNYIKAFALCLITRILFVSDE